MAGDKSTDQDWVRNIRVADGKTNKQKLSGDTVTAVDIAVQLDGDGNGNANDPAFVLLADTGSSSQLRVRDVVSNESLRDLSALSKNWEPLSVGVSDDLSGNNTEDAIIIGNKNEDGDSIRLQLRDLQTGDSIGNLDYGS